MSLPGQIWSGQAAVLETLGTLLAKCAHHVNAAAPREVVLYLRSTEAAAASTAVTDSAGSAHSTGGAALLLDAVAAGASASASGTQASPRAPFNAVHEMDVLINLDDVLPKRTLETVAAPAPAPASLVVSGSMPMSISVDETQQSPGNNPGQTGKAAMQTQGQTQGQSQARTAVRSDLEDNSIAAVAGSVSPPASVSVSVSGSESLARTQAVFRERRNRYKTWTASFRGVVLLLLAESQRGDREYRLSAGGRAGQGHLPSLITFVSLSFHRLPTFLIAG